LHHEGALVRRKGQVRYGEQFRRARKDVNRFSLQIEILNHSIRSREQQTGVEVVVCQGLTLVLTGLVRREVRPLVDWGGRSAAFGFPASSSACHFHARIPNCVPANSQVPSWENLSVLNRSGFIAAAS
jgi:hypothetical protein